MVDSDAAAGAKRGAAMSPSALKAITALRAMKTARELSPAKGMNPNAFAFHLQASAEQSAQQIGDATFTRTFPRPASSHFNVRGPALTQAGHSGPSAHAGTNSGSSEAG